MDRYPSTNGTKSSGASWEKPKTQTNQTGVSTQNPTTSTPSPRGHA